MAEILTMMINIFINKINFSMLSAVQQKDLQNKGSSYISYFRKIAKIINKIKKSIKTGFFKTCKAGQIYGSQLFESNGFISNFINLFYITV